MATSTTVAVVAPQAPQPIRWPDPPAESIARFDAVINGIALPIATPYLLMKLQELSQKQDAGEAFDPAGAACLFSAASLQELSGSPALQQHLRAHESPTAFVLTPMHIQEIMHTQSRNKSWRRLVVDFDPDAARKEKRKLLYTTEDNEQSTMTGIMQSVEDFLPFDPALVEPNGFMAPSPVQVDLRDSLSFLRSRDVFQCVQDSKDPNECAMLDAWSALTPLLGAMRHCIVENNFLLQTLSRQTSTSTDENRESRIAQLPAWMHDLPAEVLAVNTPSCDIVPLGTFPPPSIRYEYVDYC